MAGAHVCGGSQATLFNCLVEKNSVTEPGGKGGGLYASNGGHLIVKESRIVHNVAGAPFVNLTSGPCVVSGDCFYSPAFPSEFTSGDSCGFDVLKSGVQLKVDVFELVSPSSLSVGSTSYTGMYVSDSPSGVSITKGEKIVFDSPRSSPTSGGFQICQEQTSDGGGIFAKDSG
jgi:hypothetical protein